MNHSNKHGVIIDSPKKKKNILNLQVEGAKGCRSPISTIDYRDMRSKT